MMKFSIYGRMCLVLGFVFSFSACKDDDDDKSDKTTNQWIESAMRSYYLWYEEIPDKKELNFNADPEDFFYSLLASEDGKTKNKTRYYYSTIKKKKSVATRSNMGEEPTLGFEFQTWIINGAGYRAVSVLYVLPGSPAEKKGLRRGDWIHKINGANVSDGNVSDLLSGKTVVLDVSDHYSNYDTHSVELVPAMVEDDPIFLTKTFQDESTGHKKVGYMVYNHFTSGPDGDKDETYNNELRQQFGAFKAEGVEEFVLDLRYNGGGLVTSAQILAELLAPESALGNTFCYLQYNDIQSKTVTYKLEGAEQNLNLPRLFVLTSNRTASASEAVINGLRPYYDVYLLGEQTEGKNVGSITLTNDKYDYELHPIVCRIFNVQDQSEYKDGFSSDWEPDEPNSDYRPIVNHVELGDKENDVLLKAAIYWIRNGVKPPVTGFTRSSGLKLMPGYCSLDRKATNGAQEPF